MTTLDLSRAEIAILRAVAATGWRSIIDDTLAVETQVAQLSQWQPSGPVAARIVYLQRALAGNVSILSAFEPVAEKLERAI